jgi:hypothetical protein
MPSTANCVALIDVYLDAISHSACRLADQFMGALQRPASLIYGISARGTA